MSPGPKRYPRNTAAVAVLVWCAAVGGTLVIAYRQAVATARAPKPAFEQVGVASWYGPGFHGKETANGEVYNQNEITAAHRSLPLGTRAQVTNLENGKSVEVRINDRGPYVGKRVIDLSRAAAGRLGMVDEGTVSVKIVANVAPKTKRGTVPRSKAEGQRRDS
ncbi:MAG: septal ring lytic transglycosylase RlpA family protein [Gammaproteobacteria bacterium]